MPIDNQNMPKNKKDQKVVPEIPPIEEEETETIKEIGAGAASGAAKIVTSTASLAIDLADFADNKLFGNKISGKTIQEWQKTVDLSPEIASSFDVDHQSTAFKVTEGITQGVGIAIQIMSGVGAVAAGSNVAKGAGVMKALKNFSTMGGVKAVKAGAKAITSGSKVAKVGKAAAVGAAEEFKHQASREEGSGALTSMYDVSQQYFNPESKKRIEAIETEYKTGLAKYSPEAVAALDVYDSEHIKKEKESLSALENRLRASLEGAVLGGSLETILQGAVSLARATKRAKANINITQDSIKLDEAVDKRVLEAQDAGEEVTEKTRKSIYEQEKAKLKEARKQIEDLDGTVRPIDEKYLESPKKYKEWEERIAATQNDDFRVVQEKIQFGRPLNKKDTKILADEAQRLYKFNKTNAKKFKDLASGDPKKIDEIVTDPDFMRNLQKEAQTAQSTLLNAKDEMMKDQAEIVKRFRDGTAKAEDLIQYNRVQELIRAVEMQQKAAGSYAGQALASVKFTKESSMTNVNRLIESFKRRKQIDLNHPEYLDYKIKILEDSKFRKAELDNFHKNSGGVLPQTIVDIENKGFDLYRKNLLLSLGGIARNVGEGVFLSTARVAKDTVAEALSIGSKNPIKMGTSIRAMKKSLMSNQLSAFEAMKTAWKGKDMNAMSKLGMDITESEGGKFKQLMDKAMSAGQRGIVATDQLVSTMNKGHYINREANILMEDLLSQEATFKEMMSAFKTDDILSPDARNLSTMFEGHGVSLEDAVKHYDSVDGNMDKLGAWYQDKLIDSPTLTKGAEKYSNRIAMNSSIDDLQFVPKQFSKSYLAVSKTPFLRWTTPFPKPALTALDTALELNPIVSGLDVVKKFRKGSPREVRDAMASFAMTSSGAAVMWQMLDSGVVSGGGPKDPNDKKAWLEAGNKPYHLQMSDGSQLNMRGTIIGEMFGMVGETRDLQMQMTDGSIEDEDQMNTFITGSVAIMSQAPIDLWMDSLSNVVNAVGGDNVKSQGARAQLIKTFTMKAIPLVGSTAAGDVRNVIDPNRRDTSVTDRGVSGVMKRSFNEMINTMPIASTTLPTRYSFITGEKMKHGKVGFTPMAYFGSTPQGKHVRDYMSQLMTEYGAKTTSSKENDLRFTLPIKSLSIEGSNRRYKLNSEEYSQITQMVANPDGMPPLINALEEISNNLPLEFMTTQEDKDLAISQIREKIRQYKQIGSDQFRRSSEEFRAEMIDGRYEENERRQRTLTFE
jgi:hypothetical protein